MIQCLCSQEKIRSSTFALSFSLQVSYIIESYNLSHFYCSATLVCLTAQSASTLAEVSPANLFKSCRWWANSRPATKQKSEYHPAFQRASFGAR